MSLWNRLIYGRKIASGIEKLCDGPSVTMLSFKDANNVSITNNVFDSDSFAKAIVSAQEQSEIWKDQLETIRVLAGKLT